MDQIICEAVDCDPDQEVEETQHDSVLLLSGYDYLASILKDRG